MNKEEFAKSWPNPPNPYICTYVSFKKMSRYKHGQVQVPSVFSRTLYVLKFVQATYEYIIASARKKQQQTPRPANTTFVDSKSSALLDTTVEWTGDEVSVA